MLNPGHGAAKCNSPESKHPDEIVFSEHVVREFDAPRFMTDELVEFTESLRYPLAVQK